MNLDAITTGMSDNRRDPRLVPVPVEIREHAASLVREHGPRRAARYLGVSRDTAISLALGIDCMPGSLALARESLNANRKANGRQR